MALDKQERVDGTDGRILLPPRHTLLPKVAAVIGTAVIVAASFMLYVLIVGAVAKSNSESSVYINAWASGGSFVIAIPVWLLLNALFTWLFNKPGKGATENPKTTKSTKPPKKKV